MNWYTWRWRRIAWTHWDDTSQRVGDYFGSWRRVVFGLWLRVSQ
jgi:hypothetical protein